MALGRLAAKPQLGWCHATQPSILSDDGIPQVEPSYQGRIAFPVDSSKELWVTRWLFQYLTL
jgi:hypothetical protein